MCALKIHSVRLRTNHAAALADFYVRQLGFAPSSADDARSGEIALSVPGSATPLLTLFEDRAAQRAPADAAGLFHLALLLPSRPALGRWLRQTADAGVRFAGFSDHGVSEAIYLSDPDGNGLEFYADRPREAWPFEQGELHMVTEPLAVPDLLATASAHRASAPLEGASWGHLHFRVSDLDRSEAFYRSTFGVALTQRYGRSARFLAADGYHHHFGLNTWGGVHQPQPVGALGFAAATISSTGEAQDTDVRDPDGLQFHHTAA